MADNVIKALNKTVKKLKRVIDAAIEKSQFEKALSSISVSADMLYISNQYYCDEDLENGILKISNKLFPEKAEMQPDDSVIVFYDGFGLNTRGLAQIYLKALSKIGKVIYVTDERHKVRIPDIQRIVLESGRICYLKKSSFTQQIFELNGIIENVRPKYIFMYTLPGDVVAPVVLNRYKGIAKRFQINLTDHAFWLGVNSFDYCLEFRNYGATITNKYRGISLENIKILPFYPLINFNSEFKGYPFIFNEDKQKLIFSGGALYKTLGGGNKYYNLVNYLLEKYSDVVFWYAGSGDSTEIKKIIDRFPGRAFLTAERDDLFQVLKRCYFYLSTYPVSGGLMFQYSAMAGKIPLTLKFDDCDSDFLINQEQLNIEYNSYEDVCDRIDYLMNNPLYVEQASNLLKSSVIAPEVFEKQLKNILESGYSDYKVNIGDYDTESFRETYLERLKRSDINFCIAQKKFLKYGVKIFPVKTAVGCFKKLFKKLKG